MASFSTIWKYVAWGTGIAVVSVVVVRTVYYQLPSTPSEPPPAVVDVVPTQPTPQVPAGNPLLTATREQFRLWMPPYCGADLFYAKEPPSAGRLNVCVTNTISKVKTATGVQLTRDDVLAPAVKAHWLSVMKPEG